MAQRESVLPPLSGSIYIKIRQDFLELCNNDHCMAALLSYYEYKLNAIVSNIEEAQLKNKSYKPTADTYFIECSPAFLSKALLGLFGRTKIIEANNRLHEKNFITVKTEKNGNEYKTTRVALNIEPIRSSLKRLFENEQPLIQFRTTPYSEMDNPLFVSEQPPYSKTNRINNTYLNKDKEGKLLSTQAEPMDYEKFLLFWNESVKSRKIKPLREITEKRKKAIGFILKTYNKEDIREVVSKITKSDFANGNNNINWVAKFDWVFKPDNFINVLEGNYDNKIENSKAIY